MMSEMWEESMGEKKGLVTGAVFVDLSAAYDTVNHRLLLKKILENTKDLAFTDLIRALLKNRRFYVVLNNKQSSVLKYLINFYRCEVWLSPRLCSGPFALLSIYFSSRPNNLETDDTQLYVPIKADGKSQIIKLETCLSRKENFLLLNLDKTEMAVIETPC
uniref:Uncharacterized protein n=1 Tax=Sparus aurata TaxID=8175 RepID=A0A671VIV1_SPAAU